MPSAPSSSAAQHQSSAGKRPAWLVVLVAYVFIYVGLLLSGHGYPYGLDNNESYSSWWHARSLYENGLSHTKGLTDEVFAHHAAASPYIHSHQGNFPRLFTFALYVLGARSIESQIWISTFTVGLVALWLAFKFLTELISARYACIACLVMCTNYLLFAQWQVSLYNVWHVFFFFSSLRCMQVLGRTQRRKIWTAITILNFAALFYWEYVFTSFIAALCGLYVLVAYRARWKLILLGAGTIAAGACIAAGTLLLQLTAYMGWAGVRQDVHLTLTARNTAADPALLEQVASFYRKHHIIFWHNFLDAQPLRMWSAFWTSLLNHHLSYYSRPLLLVMVPLLCGWLGHLALRRLQLGPASSRVAAIVVAALGGILTWYAAKNFTEPPLLDTFSSTWFNSPAGSCALLVLACVVGGIIAWPKSQVEALTLPGGRLAISFLGALMAYAFTYRIFTGYVFSGYLHRLVPLLVFSTDLLLALGFHLVLQAASLIATSGNHWLNRIAGAAAAALLAAMAWQWLAIQQAALRLVPPDSYSFLRVLDEPRFQGRSLVSNTYPAPMAAHTHSWGYADTSLVGGYLTLTPQGFQVERDLKYLWFADRDQNQSYLTPELAVIVRQLPNPGEAAQFAAERLRVAAGTEKPSVPGLVQRATIPFQPFLQHRLLYSDESRVHIVRFDWDYPPYLVRLEEDSRKYAAQFNLRQLLALSEHSSRMRQRWRIAWRWLDDSTLADDIRAQIIGDNQSLNLAASREGQTLVQSRQIHLTLSPHANARLELNVNDATETFDLSHLAEGVFSFDWNTAQPHGKFTRVPPFPAGLHLRTRVQSGGANPGVELAYRFAQQQGRTEENTTIRLYAEMPDNKWHLADTLSLLGRSAVPVRLAEFRARNPDTITAHASDHARGDHRSYEAWLAAYLDNHPEARSREGIAEGVALLRPAGSDNLTHIRLPLPQLAANRLQFSVTPGTETKHGTEYFGLPLIPRADDDGKIHFDAVAADLVAEPPYGQLKLKLRFPVGRWPQAEPIAITGANEAGDIIYIIYTDETHIQIGFDHWFKGGPLTQPIAVDYGREHELEISMGSLYPTIEDLVFVNRSAEKISALKNRVRVQLDGQPVIDAEGDCYDADPSTVKIGRNEIKATSCNPLFSGTILEAHREWPANW